MSAEIVIVAALEREVWPLVKHWRSEPLAADGQRLPAYRQGRVLVVCSGIGAAAARRAGVAIFASTRPQVVISAGLAAALDSHLQVADVFQPAVVVDVQTGARYAVAEGQGVLLSASSVLGREAKQRLAGSYHGQAVDMEAATVALVAEQHQCRFRVVKAISEPIEFPMPSFDRYIDGQGRLHTGRFLMASAFRPTTWPVLVRLGRNTARASRALCRALAQMIEEWEHATAAVEAPARQG